MGTTPSPLIPPMIEELLRVAPLRLSNPHGQTNIQHIRDTQEHKKIPFCITQNKTNDFFFSDMSRRVQGRPTPWELASMLTSVRMSRVSFPGLSTTCSGGSRSADRPPPSKAGLSLSSRSTHSSWRCRKTHKHTHKDTQFDNSEVFLYVGYLLKFGCNYQHCPNIKST